MKTHTLLMAAEMHGPHDACPDVPDPLTPQWENCKTCGGDHWTKDHPGVAPLERHEFIRMAEDRERKMYEGHHCYGEPYWCISCGCTEGHPCISHRGSPIYTNELLEKIARER